MTITFTAFEKSPDQGQGLARDMRVRWALDGSGIVEKYPRLAARVARGVARPAYQRAFEAQAAACRRYAPLSGGRFNSYRK